MSATCRLRPRRARRVDWLCLPALRHTLARRTERRLKALFAARHSEPSWDSPWGGGRPGWHIECSVMASDLMGDNMDVHAGGSDLKFPHHDNELCQSEGARRRPSRRAPLLPRQGARSPSTPLPHRAAPNPARARPRTWAMDNAPPGPGAIQSRPALLPTLGRAAAAMHGSAQWVNHFWHFGHLHIKGLKMSKSLKNFITIREALTRDTARQIRLMFLLQAWDRPMDYSEQTIEDAKKKEKRIETYFGMVKAVLRDGWLAKPTTWMVPERELLEKLLAHQAKCERTFRTDGVAAGGVCRRGGWWPCSREACSTDRALQPVAL